MAKEKLKPLMTSFTPDGDFLATFSPSGVVKILNTSNGNLLAEWKWSDDGLIGAFSCMACFFVGKKRKKQRGTYLLAFGTSSGDIWTVDALTGESKWKSMECCHGGLAGLTFVKKGHNLCAVGVNGKAFVLNSETGELIKKFKASKGPVSSLAFSCEEKFVAIAGGKMRIIDLENEKELVKYSNDLGQLQHISISDDAKTIVTSEVGEKNLQVWSCDLSSKAISRGPVLTMARSPLALECKLCTNEQNGPVVLALSKSGVAYVWNLKATSQEEVTPAKITVNSNKTESDNQNNSNVKKSRTSIMAARLHALEEKRITVLVAYGSVVYPQFSMVNVSNPGDDIVITARDETGTSKENGMPAGEDLSDSLPGTLVTPPQSRQTNKKRTAPDPDIPTAIGVDDAGHGEDVDGVLVNDNENEPTMGEKLASLKLLDNDKTKNHEKEDSSPCAKPPSADSVNVLLKQALHADDRALLLDCLYNQDEKVIANSISLLNSSDVLKLLYSLVSIIQSRGAVLACALPWIKSLLLQHASGIISQESSLLALNSVYQLIESRVATFQSALEISSCLDLLYSGIVGDEVEETDTVPVIYEDKDESDEEETEEAVETDDDSNEEGAFDGVSDFEEIDDMSE